MVSYVILYKLKRENGKRCKYTVRLMLPDKSVYILGDRKTDECEMT